MFGWIGFFSKKEIDSESVRLNHVHFTTIKDFCWTFTSCYLNEARSSFAEQSTPANLLIVDGIASVSNLSFIDKDLDREEKKRPGVGLGTPNDEPRADR